MNEAVPKEDRLKQVAGRLAVAREIIRRDTTLVDNHLTIRLNFEDEEQLAQMWLEAVADIQWMLEEFAHE